MDPARYTACPGCQRLIREARAHAKTGGTEDRATITTITITTETAD